MSESKKNKEPWNDVTNPIYFYNVLAQMIDIDPDAPLNKSLSVLKTCIERAERNR